MALVKFCGTCAVCICDGDTVCVSRCPLRVLHSTGRHCASPQVLWIPAVVSSHLVTRPDLIYFTLCFFYRFRVGAKKDLFFF